MKIIIILSIFSSVFGFFNSLHGAEAIERKRIEALVAECQNFLMPEGQRELVIEEASKYLKNCQNILTTTDLIFFIDVSGSMLLEEDYPFFHLQFPPSSNYVNPYYPNNLWKRMDSAFLITSHLFSILKYNQNQTTPLYFFGTRIHPIIINSGEPHLNTMRQLYLEFNKHAPSPGQKTNLYDALQMAFEKYTDGERRKLFIVIIDSQPSSKADKIEKLIYKKLTKKDKKGERLKILFIRVGNDPKAIEFLTCIGKGCKKIKNNVDTKTVDWIYTQPFEKVILESILPYQTLESLILQQK